MQTVLPAAATFGAQLLIQVSSEHGLPCCKRIQLALCGCVMSSACGFNSYRQHIFREFRNCNAWIVVQLACKGNGRCAVINHAAIEAISCREAPSGVPSISDTGCCRFTYCALLCCSLLQRRDAIDCDRAAAYIASCRNFDGGFGARPGLLPCGCCRKPWDHSTHLHQSFMADLDRNTPKPGFKGSYLASAIVVMLLFNA